MFKSFQFCLLCVYTAVSFAMASGQSNIRGKMYGGQLPVAGGHVHLLSPAQSTTFGSASVSLITPGSPGTLIDAIGAYMPTDQNGNVNINNQYSCTPGVPIYFYDSMGDAGYGSNPAIANMAYLGLCGNIPQSFTITNEATTVALAYAVAGYATDPLHISYSGTSASLTGIQNAFANANNLANPIYGTANSEIPSGYATVPQSTINTIANALASCVNETSPSQVSPTSNCALLFGATSVNGVSPTTTAAAAMNMAHNPSSSTAAGIQNGTDITKILELSFDYQQFTPFLAPTSPPNDLTVGLTFSSGSIANPTAVAIDKSGNAWIASQTSANAGSSVVEISNPTTMQANSVTYPVVYTPQDQPNAIAVDAASQNIWIGTNSAVEEFSNTGVPAPGSPFLATDNNFMGGYALNFDSMGNVWIAAFSTVYELSAAGSVVSPTGGACFPGYCLPAMGNAAPSALAVDSSNNVWVTDYNSNALIELSNQGTVLKNLDPGNSGNDYDAPFGVAIDSHNNYWVANNANNYFVAYEPSSPTQFVFNQADVPPPGSNPYLTFVGIDGAGSSWFSLEDGNCSNSVCLGIAQVSGAGTPLSGPGYTIGGSSIGNTYASATAIDGSGNVWILNKYAQTVTELVGAAAPVVTPMALAVSTNTLGTRP